MESKHTDHFQEGRRGFELDGNARRLGDSGSSIEKDANRLVQPVSLRMKLFGRFPVVPIDENRDNEIQEAVASYLSTLRQGEKA